MKRIYLFVGFVLLILLAGYPFVQELRHVSDVKKSKSDFQETLNEGNGSRSRVQRSSPAWQSLSDRHQQQLRELGFFPASLRNSTMGFTLTNYHGDRVTLEDYRGQWLLINFWATWCPPCRMEMPSLDKFQEQFKQQLTVLTVNVEQTHQTIERFKNNYDFTLPILLDEDGTVARQFGTTGLPETWLITPEGKPLAKLTGPLEWHNPPASTTFANLFTTGS